MAKRLRRRVDEAEIERLLVLARSQMRYRFVGDGSAPNRLEEMSAFELGRLAEGHSDHPMARYALATLDRYAIAAGLL